MGQKVNPTGFRVGIIRTWDSVWYEEKNNFIDTFMRDLNIKETLRRPKKCRNREGGD